MNFQQKSRERSPPLVQLSSPQILGDVYIDQEFAQDVIPTLNSGSFFRLTDPKKTELDNSNRSQRLLKIYIFSSFIEQ